MADLIPGAVILDNAETIPESGCWFWMGSTNRQGYGRIHFDGYRWLAHRLSYTLFKGEIQEGLSVLHRCDIPACVRPEHLWLGTRADNAKDRETKRRGHSQVGSDNANAKLNESLVIEIRHIHAQENIGATRLSKIYGIHKSTARDIIKRKIWKHI